MQSFKGYVNENFKELIKISVGIEINNRLAM